MQINEVISEVTEKLGGVKGSEPTLELSQLYDGIINSLNSQILDLGRRANVNLVMGSVVTVAGLSVLSYFVFSPYIHPL